MSFWLPVVVSRILLFACLRIHLTHSFTTSRSALEPVRNSLRRFATISEAALLIEGNVTIVAKSDDYLVVDKPPSVVCHHSEWTGSRSQQEIPMLQRIRQAVGARINLVHRLDRGCSGCLLVTYQKDEGDMTATLSQAMAENATKTYIALVRGEGILRGEDLKQKGWFLVDRPIKNERGVVHKASTWFRFVAGQPEADGQPRASLVLARPLTGRWHQIRRHLNGLSHPILGDSSHGNSKVNQEWRSQRGMLPERTCLHLARLQLSTETFRIDARSDLAPDMTKLLQIHLPAVLEEALPILHEEGITLVDNDHRVEILPYTIPDEAKQQDI
jgi:23S rRNA-/tRNA-specific pseudouridylate synthase